MKPRTAGWIMAGLAAFGLDAVPLGVSTALAQPGPTAPAEVPPIHTNKTRFRIPYRYDPAEMQRLGAREIRLFVSTDAGRDWKHSGTVAPDARRFDYEAPTDGEYWFAVRTVDGRGQLHPPGPVNTPALKVIVDTRTPALSVNLEETSAGRVQLVWQADDEHVDPTTLRLEYVQPGDSKWQTVGVVPKPNGRTSWSVAQPGTVSVRGLVADFAGNVGRAQTQRQVAGGGRNDPASVPDLRQPIAEGTEVEPPPRTAELPGDTTAATQRPILPDPRFVGDDPDRRPSVVRPRYPEQPVLPQPDPMQPEIAASRSSAPEIVEPAIGAPMFEEAQPTNSWSVGAGPGARVVNSKSFEIDYKIEDVGPSGLSAVEFYITTDDGTKWWRYGNDEDRQSPFAVTVPREGVYGFAMRARSGVGLAADPPQPGEQPSIVINVDRTAPKVTLLPVQQGTGRALSQVLIRWNIDDANPSDKPVALSYAEDRNGPWEPITGWTTDEKQYTWTVGPGVPARFYIRLTARDAAGNVTRIETDRPVLVDLKKPSARIVDVQSVEGQGGSPR